MDLPIRPRRNRKSPSIRRLIRESHLTPAHWIYPLFVTDQTNDTPILSLPGQSRLCPSSLLRTIDHALTLGIHSFALFPVIPDEQKNRTADEAWNEHGLIPRLVSTIKQHAPHTTIITDVALDPYNSDGHDGLVRDDGTIANDETVALLCRQALAQARAGSDIIAPSDMMDGRVGEIRKSLDSEGFTDVSIMAYTAKYASSFYGPFRGALESTPKSGDKKTYQMDPANRREALREALLDTQQGADILMVKPAGAYLDIISDLHNAVPLPIAAYQVSGEYLMLKAASAAGWINEKSATLESLTAIHRAGADIILTYYAIQAAEWLAQP